MKRLENLKSRAKEIKAQAFILVLAYRDKRTPIIAKILIGITVGYLLSPVDLIPDFIPVLGLLDDVLLIPSLIALSIKLIPKEVLEEKRRLAKENPRALQKSNWFFAAIIICLWLLVFFYALRFASHLSN